MRRDDGADSDPSQYGPRSVWARGVARSPKPEARSPKLEARASSLEPRASSLEAANAEGRELPPPAPCGPSPDPPRDVGRRPVVPGQRLFAALPCGRAALAAA